jgi:hypothetical protein
MPGEADSTNPALGRPELLDQVASLPPAVREAVVQLASRALGALAAADVPRQLAAVARFTPAKRARVGSSALARVLDTDPAFRAAIAAALPALPAPPATEAGADPIADAARAFLLRLPDAADRMALALEVSEVTVLRRRNAELAAQVEELTGALAAVSPVDAGPPPGPVARTTDADVRGREEADRLRARLRERGRQVREAEVAVAAAREESAAAERRVAAAEQVIARERATAAQWREKADQAQARAEQARAALDRMRDRASGERAAADRRVELLLDALQGAALGLRAQWKVATGGPDPADLVAARLPLAPRDTQRAVDPALLGEWLTLPGAHLVVDGYNVTKTGYGEMTLADQRIRLTRSLGALAARTAAEVTVVFDGAAVTAAPPSVRGVRVLFSPPGVIADQVVRDLVAQEPAGRVVVVVSSDKEVVDGVRRSGARTAPAEVLLALLTR